MVPLAVSTAEPGRVCRTPDSPSFTIGLMVSASWPSDSAGSGRGRRRSGSRSGCFGSTAAGRPGCRTGGCAWPAGGATSRTARSGSATGGNWSAASTPGAGSRPVRSHPSPACHGALSVSSTTRRWVAAGDIRPTCRRCGANPSGNCCDFDFPVARLRPSVNAGATTHGSLGRQCRWSRFLTAALAVDCWPTSSCRSSLFTCRDTARR